MVQLWMMVIESLWVLVNIPYVSLYVRFDGGVQFWHYEPPKNTNFSDGVVVVRSAQP